MTTKSKGATPPPHIADPVVTIEDFSVDYLGAETTHAVKNTIAITSVQNA